METQEAALRALLQYLIDPTEEHKEQYCAAHQDFATTSTIDFDEETKALWLLKDLHDGNYLHWVDLYNDVKDIPSLLPLYEQAEKVHKVWVEKIEAHMTT